MSAAIKEAERERDAAKAQARRESRSGQLLAHPARIDETLYFRYDYDNRLLATIGRFYAICGYDPEGNISQKGLLTITYSDRQLTAKIGSTSVVTDNFDAAGGLSARDDSQGRCRTTRSRRCRS